MNEETAYFISDAHLGISLPEAAGREEALISFLREVAPGARFLFILGDLFDFWVHGPHQDPRPHIPAILLDHPQGQEACHHPPAEHRPGVVRRRR